MSEIVSIVVTYHPDDEVIDVIRELAKQTDHVVVVDNSATSCAQDLLSRAFKSEPETYTLLFNSENLGVAAALNQGITAESSQSAEWILTMDQDSQVTDGMVEAMLSTFRNLPEKLRSRVASISPILVSQPDLTKDTPIVSDARILTFREVDTAITSGNLVKREAWQITGGYDSKLFIDYVDHDFCFRLRRAGYHIIACDGARLVHSIGSGIQIRRFGRNLLINQHSPLRFYYMTRNGFYFWKTYRGGGSFLRADKINMLKLFLKAMIADNQRGKRLHMFLQGYLDFRRGLFGSYPRRRSFL